MGWQSIRPGVPNHRDRSLDLREVQVGPEKTRINSVKIGNVEFQRLHEIRAREERLP